MYVVDFLQIEKYHSNIEMYPYVKQNNIYDKL